MALGGSTALDTLGSQAFTGGDKPTDLSVRDSLHGGIGGLAERLTDPFAAVHRPVMDSLHSRRRPLGVHTTGAARSWSS